MRLLRRGDSGLSLPLFALAHVLIFAGVFRAIYPIAFSGTGLYFGYASQTVAGQLPYRDFVLEYPPVALGLFVIPRLFASSFRWYYVGFQVEVIVADLLCLAALAFIARRENRSTTVVLTAYTIGLLAVGPIALHQYDIFPALFTLLALAAFVAGRPTLSGAALGFGVMTKVYPILLAPIFVAIEWQRGRRPEIGRAVAGFAAALLLSILPWLVTSPSSLDVMVRYHTQRGIHVDSMWASIAFLLRALGVTWIDNQFAFGSWNIVGPVTPLLLALSTVALLAVLALTYLWWLAIARRESTRPISAATVARACAVVLLGSMAASKVLSPQYLFWPLPFLALIEKERLPLALATFAATGAITYWEYPLHYDSFLAHAPLEVFLFGVRNVLIAVLALLLVRGHVRTVGEAV